MVSPGCVASEKWWRWSQRANQVVGGLEKQVGSVRLEHADAQLSIRRRSYLQTRIVERSRAFPVRTRANA